MMQAGVIETFSVSDGCDGSYFLITVTMSSNTYKYKVKMTCGGCSNAVSRALAKAQGEGAGIDDYKVILDDQYVEVTGTIPLDELTKRIEKTGKEILEKPEIPAAEPVAVA
ncbi:copper chaperone taha [Pyrrhoderma noxium]|uniref:Copper chaperone taha n=1 Tax=Pyrrhoderma noxium TaxID=2282107 RepID=A0A286UWE9_9AGAM|nr:copper chaperone taha [Pyrrhoderma noxium]